MVASLGRRPDLGCGVAPLGHSWLRRHSLVLSVLGCNLKNNRMISVHFQGKSFNITVIQDYAPTSNAEEAKVEQF